MSDLVNELHDEARNTDNRVHARSLMLRAATAIDDMSEDFNGLLKALAAQRSEIANITRKLDERGQIIVEAFIWLDTRFSLTFPCSREKATASDARLRRALEDYARKAVQK